MSQLLDRLPDLTLTVAVGVPFRKIDHVHSALKGELQDVLDSLAFNAVAIRQPWKRGERL